MILEHSVVVVVVVVCVKIIQLFSLCGILSSSLPSYYFLPPLIIPCILCPSFVGFSVLAIIEEFLNSGMSLVQCDDDCYGHLGE